LKKLKKSLILDATVIITLRELESLDLLEGIQKMCDANIIIPQAVVDEFQKANTNPPISDASVVKVQRVELPIDIPKSLGKGESQAIAIALAISQEQESHENITYVVTDDKHARSVCNKLGVKAIGTLGLIELAKKCGIITKGKAIELLNKIPNTSLYITSALLNSARHKIQHQI